MTPLWLTVVLCIVCLVAGVWLGIWVSREQL